MKCPDERIEQGLWDLYNSKPLLVSNNGQWIVQFGRELKISFVHKTFLSACRYLGKFVGRFEIEHKR